MFEFFIVVPFKLNYYFLYIINKLKKYLYLKEYAAFPKKILNISHFRQTQKNQSIDIGKNAFPHRVPHKNDMDKSKQQHLRNDAAIMPDTKKTSTREVF